MNYDLTPYLTTVAAASASIVAILGGFIATKLITISGERTVVLNKLNSIEEELRFKQVDREKRQRENDSENALSFILEQLDGVLNMKSVNDVYDMAESQCIERDRLQEYWEKALELYQELKQSLLQATELNSDCIPKDISRKYAGDYFSYGVLDGLMQRLKKDIEDDERRKQEELRKNDPFASLTLESIKPFADIEVDDVGRVITPTWNYTQNEQQISRLNTDISILEFQKGQLEEQRRTLTRPKGMRLGLVIFGYFAIGCIVIPLAMSPYGTDSFCAFLAVKISILILFIIGLVAIFCYLAYLLRWKDNSINSEDRN